MATETVVNLSAGERLEQPVRVTDIIHSQNPRQSLRGALEVFHEKGVFDKSPEERAEFVKFIEDNYPHIRERATSYRSITNTLGNDVPNLKGQLQAVTLRKMDTKEGERYGIVQGESRILAWALIEAETGKPQKVRAVIESRMTLDEAFERALVENIERAEMSPGDLAASFNEMLTKRTNPETTKKTLSDGKPNPKYNEKNPKGRPYTLTEIADKFKKTYHWVRSYAALVYLSDKDKQQMNADWAAGKRSVTKYCTKAAGILSELKKAGKDVKNSGLIEELAQADSQNQGNNGGNPVDNPNNAGTITVVPETRRRVLSLKKVEELFDNSDANDTSRLQALAEVMGIDLDTAKSESLKRIEEKAKREAASQPQPQPQTETTQNEPVVNTQNAEANTSEPVVESQTSEQPSQP